MAYTKTIQLNQAQDQWLQNILQPFKDTRGEFWEEQTSSEADQVLALLETAIPTNVS